MRAFDCPKCGAKNGVCVGVHYGSGNKYRYRGISEWQCGNILCDYRIGNWCEKELTGNEVEPMFCKGMGHPKLFNLND